MNITDQYLELLLFVLETREENEFKRRVFPHTIAIWILILIAVVLLKFSTFLLLFLILFGLYVGICVFYRKKIGKELNETVDKAVSMLKDPESSSLTAIEVLYKIKKGEI